MNRRNLLKSLIGATAAVAINLRMANSFALVEDWGVWREVFITLDGTEYQRFEVRTRNISSGLSVY